MAALFKSPSSNKLDGNFHYTRARTSSDEGEPSLSSDGLLEKDTIQLPKQRSILRRYAFLILLHLLIFLLYICLLYFVTSSYASTRRLNGPGLVFCAYGRFLGFGVHTESTQHRHAKQYCMKNVRSHWVIGSKSTVSTPESPALSSISHGIISSTVRAEV